MRSRYFSPDAVVLLVAFYVAIIVGSIVLSLVI